MRFRAFMNAAACPFINQEQILRHTLRADNRSQMVNIPIVDDIKRQPDISSVYHVRLPVVTLVVFAFENVVYIKNIKGFKLVYKPRLCRSVVDNRLEPCAVLDPKHIPHRDTGFQEAYRRCRP